MWHCPHSVGWALQHQSTQPLPDVPTGQSKEGSSATEAPLPRYVRLTTKLSHHNTDTESNWGNWPRRWACKTVPILGEKRGTLVFVTLRIPVVWERSSSRKPGVHLEVLSACVPFSLSSTVAPWRKCAFFCVNSYLTPLWAIFAFYFWEFHALHLCHSLPPSPTSNSSLVPPTSHLLYLLL